LTIQLSYDNIVVEYGQWTDLMDDKLESELRIFVHQFLNEFKVLIYVNKLSITDRLKNRDALLELGFTDKQKKEIILSLSVLDYSSGPIKDNLKAGDYWVFGKKIDSVEVYIKLKIVEYDDEEYAVCFSFHKSESPLKYPFKD
jgi:hypothetical protein